MYNYVIAGKYKGRKLFIPKTGLRPTTNLVREALFSIIGNRIENKSFLDVFAGSGIIGIEALSRGANKVSFIELNTDASICIKKNLEIILPNNKIKIHKTFKVSENNKKTNIENLNNDNINESIIEDTSIFNMDFRKFFKYNNEKFDFIFFSPPYFEKLEEDIINSIYNYKPLKSDGIAIIQIFKKVDLDLSKTNLKIIDERRYGITKLIFITY